jgi:hypothetical protein
MRTGGALLIVVLAMATPSTVVAAEHPSLAKARALYNAGDYDGAITAAGAARSDPASADAAALVTGRAHLERYRVASSDPADLVAAREALSTARIAALLPRDQVDLLVGLGQALFLANAFGAAAELFDTALARAGMLPYRDRMLLLDWWATAVDRDAQGLQSERRTAALARVVSRMDDELAADAGHPTANYWLAVAAQGSGDLERAWHAAVAAWVRAPLRPDTAPTVRQDIDRFMTTVLIPDRARTRPAREQAAALDEFRAEWDATKEQWK